MEPTEKDLEDPVFNAIWEAIKGWDIQREPGDGYAGATGTDVMAILSAVRELSAKELSEAMSPTLVYFAGIRLGAYATVGKYSNQVVPDLLFMDAIKRWADDHEIEE